MERGTAQSHSATSTPQTQQKRSVDVMRCYKCPELAQGMDEHGRPRLHCIKIGGAVNPQGCGRPDFAGCEE